jgi:hypothetical protein
MMVVVGGVGSQPVLGAGLTAVPGFVGPFDSHLVGLKQLLDDIAVGIVEFATEISPSKASKIAHTIDEKFRVSDAVFLFELCKELFSGNSSPALRKSCGAHDFRLHVDGSVEPRCLLMFELDLFLINRNTVWGCCEVLIVMIGVLVLDRGAASFDAEPLT